MALIHNYLQKAWGDSVDNATMDDIRSVISEVMHINDEHAAFWVTIVNDSEQVLEVHKDLTVYGMFNDNYEIKFSAPDWDNIERLYDLFLSGKLEQVKSLMENLK